METTSVAATARSTTVAFTNCFDGSTFGRAVYLTADEEQRLRNVLAALRDYGFILDASFEPVLPGYGFADVADHLRATIGSPIADLALAATARSVPAIDPAPAAVMPVWPFEPEGGDALLSSARLWGVDLLVEALRVEDDDDPTPVPAVRDRFRRWTDASGHGGRLKTPRLPGRGGCFVVFAAAAPARSPTGGKGGVGRPAGTPASSFLPSSVCVRVARSGLLHPRPGWRRGAALGSGLWG
jgi:hypothetical protein